MTLLPKFCLHLTSYFFFIIGLLVASALPVEAKLLDTTDALRSGKLYLGAEPTVGLAEPNPFGIRLHERVGLSSGIGLVLAQRFWITRSDSIRFDFAFKSRLVRRRRRQPWGVAWWLGGYFETESEEVGATSSLMLDYKLRRITPYAALDLDLAADDGVDARFGLIGGFAYAMARNASWFVEAGGYLSGRIRNHFISTGLRIRL